MKVAKEKAFERLCKLEKGKISGCLTVIRRRHLESTKLSRESVTQCSETRWTVVSSDGTQNYTVTRDTEKCPVNCHLQCKDCNICIHSSSCNCMDALVNHTICKHIHLVARNNPIAECPDSNKNTCMLSGEDLLLNETHTTLLETVAPYHEEEDVKITIKHQLMTLMSRVEHVTNTDALLAAEKHLHSATSLLNVMSSGPPPDAIPPTTTPANKDLCRQRRYFSTKRKCEKPQTRLAKPSKQEGQRIKLALQQGMPLYPHSHKGDTQKASEFVILSGIHSIFVAHRVVQCMYIEEYCFTYTCTCAMYMYMYMYVNTNASRTCNLFRHIGAIL